MRLRRQATCNRRPRNEGGQIYLLATYQSSRTSFLRSLLREVRYESSIVERQNTTVPPAEELNIRLPRDGLRGRILAVSKTLQGKED